MTSYPCEDEQNTEITFLAMSFYTIIGMNKYANKKR